MMDNNNNQNLIKNMDQLQNQINPLMNMNSPMLNQINNNNSNQNNIQMNMQINNNIINLNERIIELENIIKQKDLEIENLKKQLESGHYCNLDHFFCFSSLDLKFKFIPSGKQKNEIEFQESFNKNYTFSQVKKRIAKILNKKLDNLLFINDIDDDIRVGDLSSNSIFIIKEVINEEDCVESDEEHSETKDIKFYFHLNEMKKSFQFQEKCNMAERFIKVKMRIAKKYNKNFNNLIFLLNCY